MSLTVVSSMKVVLTVTTKVVTEFICAGFIQFIVIVFLVEKKVKEARNVLVFFYYEFLFKTDKEEKVRKTIKAIVKSIFFLLIFWL